MAERVTGRLAGRVTVVTDSSACLPASRDGLALVVVPLRVLAGGAAADDALGALPDAIAAELQRGERLTTARPSPERFAAAYAAAVAGGATAIVSIHLSAELSGTLGSARLAAAKASVPVHVVDSQSIGAGLGLAVAAAVRAARRGSPVDEVAQAAAGTADGLGSFFALDSQDQLRAGGRLTRPGGRRPGAAGALLVSRPLLEIRDGRIAVLERVRTRGAAQDRLSELAAEFAAGRRVDLAVQHIDNPAGAAALSARLSAAMPGAASLCVVEAGTAIRAHTGPGLLGVVVAPARPSP